MYKKKKEKKRPVLHECRVGINQMLLASTSDRCYKRLATLAASPFAASQLRSLFSLRSTDFRAKEILLAVYSFWRLTC